MVRRYIGAIQKYGGLLAVFGTTFPASINIHNAAVHMVYSALLLLGWPHDQSQLFGVANLVCFIQYWNNQLYWDGKLDIFYKVIVTTEEFTKGILKSIIIT